MKTETLLAGSGTESIAKDSDEASIDNGSTNGDITISTSNFNSLHPIPQNHTKINLKRESTNFPPVSAASSGSNNSSIDVIAARDKSLISQAMEKVTKSLKADSFFSSSPLSDGDFGADESDVEDSASTDDLLNQINDSVINDRLIRFRLATPTPMPSYLNVHFICETASRLLFLSLHWVRSIPAFSLLR